MTNIEPIQPRCRCLCLLAGVVLLSATGCGSRGTQGPAPDDLVDRPAFAGIASYYSDALDGNTTASGQPYDRNALTAAHRTLPFGTQVRVTNLENGASVVLRVNDRGPFVEGRVIDVSRRAAEALDFVRQGLVRVEVRVIDGP